MMRPRLRLIFAACSMIISVFADAVMITASAPTLSVSSVTYFTTSAPVAGLMPIMPFFFAISILFASRSMPITLHPFATSSSAVISPISPNPTTTMVSPSCGSQSRIPCSPIEPMTVKAASSSLTLSGMCATRFFGTHTNSACCPFDATLSPIA